jgi:hypothetical protein
MAAPATLPFYAEVAANAPLKPRRNLDFAL